MVEYPIDVPNYDMNNWDLQIYQAKIKGYMFDHSHDMTWFGGISAMWGMVIIYSSRELNATELNDLTTAATTLDGLRPTETGWTLIEIPDFINDWRNVETQTGIKIDYAFFNPATGKVELWTYGDLTTQKKNSVINGLKNMILITKK